MNYITKDDIIIFDPSFDDPLDHTLLTNYNQIIFSDYKLSDDLFDAHKNNHFNLANIIESKFNHKVNLITK